MNKIFLKTICDVCDGTLFGTDNNNEVTGRIVIDSREVGPGDLFAAFVGEKTDGHTYIPVAFEGGAACCLAEHYDKSWNGPVIVVKSVQNAVERLAEYYRGTLSIPVVGITGSNGKTSAKEMISCVLSKGFNVLKTDKNLNNQLGVPMTVSSVSAEHTAAVIEMGVSKIGDMELLGRIVKPDIAVFTNIGHAHLEYLGDLDGVYNEKTAMLNYMRSGSPVVYNACDAKLVQLEALDGAIGVGISSQGSLRADNISYSVENNTLSFEIVDGNIRQRAVIHSYGYHLVLAALEAIAVGKALGMTLEDAIMGIEDYQPVGRRSSIVKTDCITIVDDCYNANPDSVKSSIDSLKVFKGRRICILGDMLELGADENKLHYEAGEYAVNNRIDIVLCAGRLSENTARGAGSKGVYYETVDNMLDSLKEQLQAGDTVLVKASRGMHFERISEYLKTIELK